MKCDGALIRQIGEVPWVVDQGMVGGAVVLGDLDRVDRIREMAGCVLLQEALVFDSVRITLERERSTGKPRQHHRSDGHVMLHHALLRDAGDREDDLVGVGDPHVASLALSLASDFLLGAPSLELPAAGSGFRLRVNTSDSLPAASTLVRQ